MCELFGLRSSVARFKSQRPFNSAQKVLLIIVTVPNRLIVTKRGVENLSFTELFAPGNRIVTRLLRIRVFVQVEQFMGGLRIVALDDIDLLLLLADIVAWAEVLCGWMISVGDDAVH